MLINFPSQVIKNFWQIPLYTQDLILTSAIIMIYQSWYYLLLSSIPGLFNPSGHHFSFPSVDSISFLEYCDPAMSVSFRYKIPDDSVIIATKRTLGLFTDFPWPEPVSGRIKSFKAEAYGGLAQKVSLEYVYHNNITINLWFISHVKEHALSAWDTDSIQRIEG